MHLTIYNVYVSAMHRLISVRDASFASFGEPTFHPMESWLSKEGAFPFLYRKPARACCILLPGCGGRAD